MGCFWGVLLLVVVFVEEFFGFVSNVFAGLQHRLGLVDRIVLHLYERIDWNVVAGCADGESGCCEVCEGEHGCAWSFAFVDEFLCLLWLFVDECCGNVECS